MQYPTSIILKIMKNKNSIGFSIIELLVVVAIIGILAAVGIPMYQGYVETTKKTNALNNLSSIYVTQEEYKADNNQYYFTNSASSCIDRYNGNINEVLFEGTQVLDKRNDADYRFCIASDTNGSTYKAYAIKNQDSSIKFTIDQQNNICKENCN